MVFLAQEAGRWEQQQEKGQQQDEEQQLQQEGERQQGDQACNQRWRAGKVAEGGAEAAKEMVEEDGEASRRVDVSVDVAGWEDGSVVERLRRRFGDTGPATG